MSIEELTKEYVKKRDELDRLNHKIDTIKARIYLSENVQGFGNQQSRDSALQEMFLLDHSDLAEKKLDLNGETRALFYLREVRIERMKEKRTPK